MTSLAASVASNPTALNIMPPEFFNSLMGSTPIKDPNTNNSSDNGIQSLNKNLKNESAVTPMTAAALSSAVRNMLNTEFLRQKWLYSQRYI